MKECKNDTLKTVHKIHFKIDLLNTNNFPEAGVKTEGTFFVLFFFVEQSTELISDKTSCVQTHSQEKTNKQQPDKTVGFIFQWLLLQQWTNSLEDSEAAIG